MAYFHISGRPRPSRVNAILEPGEPATAAAALSSGRGLRSTMMMQVPQEKPRKPPIFWAAVGSGGVVVIALAVWLHPAPPPPDKPAVKQAVAPPKPSYFGPSKPVLTDENWTYGRSGAPPKQVVPSAAAIAAYKNEMDKLAEKQKKALAAIP